MSPTQRTLEALLDELCAAGDTDLTFSVIAGLLARLKK